MREKLIELLMKADYAACKTFQNRDDNDVRTVWQVLADHLIANGVVISNSETTTKWIPVTERLPESGKEAVMIALLWGEVDIGWCEDERWGSEFVNEYEDGEVTHWMPLPDPPKGE